MSNLIREISFPISDDIKNFNKFFKNNLNSSNVKLINSVINYLCKTKGKQFRVILCLLCSRLTNKDPNELTFLSASTSEILHVATLLHDDIVDDAEIRRGWPTINKIWKNKISLLVGDYMFSKALINITELNDFESIKLLAEISKRLSEGEISQIEYALNKNMDEDKYFQMISDKTASLISAACYLGLHSTEQDNKLGASIKKFGEFLGIAYQLKDDIFDVIGNINNTGKKSNLDLKKNMLTLPYIYSISTMNKKDKNDFLLEIRKSKSRAKINKIKKIIIENKGIVYSEEKILEYSNKAKKELDNFPESIFKNSLIKAIDFNLTRKY